METRQKIGEWIGNYFMMIISIFMVLIVALVVSWPIGFLCKQVVNLFSHGYSVW